MSTLVLLVGWFFCGIIGIGIMRFFSTKINKFIYESNAFVCYTAFILRGLTWFNVSFFKFLDEYLWGIISGIIYVSTFVLIILTLFYYWKYHIEMNISIFLTAFIFGFTHWEKPFYLNFGIANPGDFLRGVFILGILILFLLLVIFLRKIGLYDFRSRKDKWLETAGEGPYKRISKKIQEI